MNAEQARHYLKKDPREEQVVRQILQQYRLDYEKSNNWELRDIRIPDMTSITGETSNKKLYIANNFIVNISPLTKELLKTIEEKFTMEESILIKETRQLRLSISEIMMHVKNNGSKSLIIDKIIDSLTMARHWLWLDLKRNLGEVGYTEYPDTYQVEKDKFNQATDEQLLERLELLSMSYSSGYEQTQAIDNIKEALGWYVQLMLEKN